MSSWHLFSPPSLTCLFHIHPWIPLGDMSPLVSKCCCMETSAWASLSNRCSPQVKAALSLSSLGPMAGECRCLWRRTLCFQWTPSSAQRSHVCYRGWHIGPICHWLLMWSLGGTKFCGSCSTVFFFCVCGIMKHVV